MRSLPDLMSLLIRNRGLLFPLGAAMLIFVILIPLPTGVLDMLLLTNILLSTMVLMTVMYIRGPLEFSSFPALLLALTLLRLVSNTATTRLILANGGAGTSAAGHVVEAFGVFVAGNSLAVGVIIFGIIMVIQFVVITKGATRIAEVAARFTLDGMPGKQMAIDADLNAGLIDDVEAKRRRKEVTAEADFFGAMDGASKFVRGDAIAGIVITFINVLGGLYVGMVEHDMTFMRSLEVYTKLTIGDGLASAVPAFILSVGAGMLVTRSAAQTNMGEEVLGQLLAKPVALAMSAGFLGALALTPLPKVPLLTLGLGCGLLAFFINRSQVSMARMRVVEKQQKEPPKVEQIESHLAVDALELQLGISLLPMVDKSRGGDLLDRVAGIRKQIAIDLGMIVPPVRIRDNRTIEPTQYAVLLRGQEIARGELYPDQLMAIDSGLGSEPLHGIETREPAFNLQAWWIAADQRDQAERRNYTVVEPSGVLATHLTEVIKRNSPDLVTRADTHKLIDNLKRANAALVDEVIPSLLKVGDVQRVLQGLLRERVPIRDLETILETLGNWAGRTKDIEILTEYVRHAMARSLCSLYKSHDNVIHCVTLDPSTEDYLSANIQRLDGASALVVPPDRQTQLAQRLREHVERASASAGGATMVILCAPAIRLWVRRLVEPLLPATPVLSLNEVVRGLDVHAHGVLSLDVQRTNIPRPIHA